MSEAASVSTVCRQALGLSGDHAAVRRKPGSSDIGHELTEEVSLRLARTIDKWDTDGISDLNHSNQYVVGLALCTLGNIASVEMSRDLFPEVESLITTANPYIRRKAALCAMRICRKVPDLQEHFLEKAKLLLSDRNHGVLLCGLTLATDLCEAEESEEGPEGVIEMFRPLAGGLVRTLKSLTTSGYAPEHDVSGITDPFLQVKILRFFASFGPGRCHDQRTHQRYPGSGGYQHGIIEERGKFYLVRGCTDDLGHRSGLRFKGSRCQHPRKIPCEQRQQHPLCRSQHPYQGCGGGTQCGSETS
jgi:Vesicle coat complex, various subunits